MSEAPGRRLGYVDVVFYTIVATIGIRWLPVAAVLGPASLPLWLLALVVFYVPLSVATVELTSRFPGTGSLYGWARDGLGPISGFVCGWFYWVSLLPYFASLVYFLASLALSAVGADVHDTKLYLAISIMIVLVAMAFQLEGLSFSKWLPNIGALGSWTIFFLLVFAAVLVVIHGKSATDFLHANYVPPASLDTAILWGPMVFALAGSETLAFLKDEIRGGLGTILKSLAILGVSMAAIYMVGTAAMLVMMPESELTRLTGLPDALRAVFFQVGYAPLAMIAIAGLALSQFGGLSAWFLIATRVPFEAGIDNFLPAAFTRQNPKTGAPVPAIILQGILTLAMVILGQSGAGAAAAYDYLLNMAVLTTTIPYVFVFLVYLMPQRWPEAAAEAWQPPGGAVTSRILGIVGMIATLTAIVCSMIPSATDPNPWATFLKIVFTSFAMLAIGLLFYWTRTRGRGAPPAGS
jgi:glutamate:GABA antiporter